MKSQTYNIRVQICEKCYQHYNQSINANQKSCHAIKKVNNRIINEQSRFNFHEEQQQYKQNFEGLINELNIVQNQFDDFNVPTFNILRNKPFKYLTKAPDTKLSTKRYLNQCTNKIVQFPRRDSFEIHFQNLFLFSKLSYQQWPNFRFIARVIKILVEYCERQGPLMQKLNEFINPQIDIKSPDQNQNKLTLYEYLVLSSASNDPLVESYQEEDQLIQILEQIISGITYVNLGNRIQYSNAQQKTFKKQVLPYTIFDSKIKSSTMKSIYLGKQNNTERNKYYKHRIQLTNDQNREANKNKANKTMRENNNKAYRPLSSNLSFKQKSLELIKAKGNNKIFNMIKMGDFEQNMQQKGNQNSTYISKSLSKENSNLFVFDKKLISKQKNDTTKMTKLFLSNNFQVVKNDLKKGEQNSIIWTNFTKTSPPDHRDSGSQLSVNFNQTDGFFNIKNVLKKNPSTNDFNMKGSLKGSQKPKIVPSKKLARASMFLNQRQKNNLIEQLKIIESNSVSKSEKSKQENSQKEKSQKKKKIKNNVTGVVQKKSFSSSQSSVSSKKKQLQKKLSQEPLSSQDVCEMKQEYKLNVLRQSLAKRKSEQSLLSMDSKQRDSRLNEIGEKKISNQLLKIDKNSLMIKSPSKLSVKSRRKSSFYYSNQKNNSLVQMIHSHQGKHEKDHKQKKLRRKASERKSRIVNRMGQPVEMGVQVNFSQQSNKVVEIKVFEQNDSSSQSDRHCIYNTKISVPKSKDTYDDLSQIQLKKSRQNQKQNLKNNSLTPSNISRSAKVSHTKRISKISLQSHLGLKLNTSNLKDQNDELIEFFPQNRFQHAFIVQKFTQKDFYQLEIKKNFSMISSEDNNPFEFNIMCQEHYRPFEIESLRDMFERCSEKKMVLFPKIFQQIQNYSTPLTQVVNRLLKFHPLVISRLFTNPHGTSSLGQYCIWIYDKDINQFKPVYINDEIPFFEMQHDVNSFFMPRKLKDPVYGPVTNENSIWFILLQKALAKALGGYYKLTQTSIADIFKMLTGCPSVNVENFSRQKLQKIFDKNIFLNKKAYVYGLRKQGAQNLRIDRIVGIKTNKESNLTLVKVEQKENTQAILQLQAFVRKYDQLSLVFFSLSYVFNQIKLFPSIDQQKVQKFVGFHIINQEPDDRNDFFICLGGFHRKNLTSTITIFKETVQNRKQVQQSNQFQSFQNKYIYYGKVSKSGNYFFETLLQYGKYFCLIEADFEQANQYNVSTYSSKPIYIKRSISKEIDKEMYNQLKLHSQQNSHLDQNMIVYDFKDEEITKKSNLEPSQLKEVNQIQTKWIVDIDQIQDKQVVEQRKQRRISSIIKLVEKQQQKNQRNKLKMQLKSHQKDSVIKMIQKIQEKSKYIALHDNFGFQKKIKKKKVQDLKNISVD